MAKHLVPHDLSPDVAKQVTEKAFASYAAKFADYNPRMRWANDSRAEVSFMAKGVTVRGSLDIQPKAVEIDLDVPFLLLPFKKRTIEVVEREIREWIGKAKAGTL